MNFEAVIQSLSAGQNPLIVGMLTFAAGVLASAICPCTVPVGLGIASFAGASETESRRSGLYVAVAFFVGVVASLTVLGALAGQLGALATEAFGRDWALAMAVLSLLAAAAAFLWPRVETGRLTALRRPGLAGAFVYGLVFSVGTSVAPLLLLLTVAAAIARPEMGILLAFIFGLGRGLPFLVAGAAGSLITRVARLSLWGRPLQIISGIMLLLVSGYYANIYIAFT